MSFCVVAQTGKEAIISESTIRMQDSTSNTKPSKAPINWYKSITYTKDTVVVDTSLVIKNDYRLNYYRKDLFGLLPLANEGQTYNVLDFAKQRNYILPQMGFSAKHYAYLEYDNVNYYRVPTAMSELMYRSVMEQGQVLDAFITFNTSERINISVGYKGIRSLGKYINALTTNGVLQLSASYNSSKTRYYGNYHFTSQDFTNHENGGITSIENFESGQQPYIERARLDVRFKDAKSLLKGSRYFANHYFRINKNDTENNIKLHHQFYYENKKFNFTQNTVSDWLGPSYVSSEVNDMTRYNQMYNAIGVLYNQKTIGDLSVNIENLNYNYYYKRVTINLDNIVIPNQLNDNITYVTGKYQLNKNNWKAYFKYSKALDSSHLSNLEAEATYQFSGKEFVEVYYQNANKIPDLNFNLYQSDYVNYNWYNDFNNQKINNLKVQSQLSWIGAELQLSNIRDYLYFEQVDSPTDKIFVAPKQYQQTINYLGISVNKEFKFGKFALDNTIKYQKVSQDQLVLNLPQFITRNTLYYSDYLFKKAMFIQTGFTLNYFTDYYANEYNGVIGEFYVQRDRKIGNFPVIDFFINAKVSTAQIFLKVEHLNSRFTGYNYYATPNNPYRDLMIRFGIVWRFFS
ncbi:MAG: putative porin [Bacteroidota bacterium]|nr:putative porin [Bacteroidota bacterium]